MNPNEKKVLSLLGLAMRGRNLVSGEQQVVEAIRDGSAYMVVLATDASANTSKLYHDKTTYYEVPLYEFGTKELLGGAIGKDYRSAVAVTESGLANSIIRLLEN